MSIPTGHMPTPAGHQDAGAVSNAHAAEDRAFVNAVLRLSGAYRRRLENVCATHGLTFQQYTVLAILRDAQASGDGPLPTMTVAERMNDPEPGITRMMNRLERMGFLRRERSREDARVSLCRISRKGQATLKRMDTPMADLYSALAGSIPSIKRVEIKRILFDIPSSLAEE